jgi:hypothetical protein
MTAVRREAAYKAPRDGLNAKIKSSLIRISPNPSSRICYKQQ